MWGLLVAAALTFGLVRAATGLRPETKSARMRLKESARFATYVSKLSRKTITLDEAEDGVVLARKFGNMDLEKKFRAVAISLKKGRS